MPRANAGNSTPVIAARTAVVICSPWGEDVRELIDLIAAQLKVIEIARIN
jgi:hypothetical protein